MKKILNFLLLFLFIILTINITINASTADVYNIVTCPGEDMATQMQINWQSSTTMKSLKLIFTLSILYYL